MEFAELEFAYTEPEKQFALFPSVGPLCHPSAKLTRGNT